MVSAVGTMISANGVLGDNSNVGQVSIQEVQLCALVSNFQSYTLPDPGMADLRSVGATNSRN